MLTVKPDPRVHATRAELEHALAFYQQIEGELARTWQAYGEVDAVHRQLETLKKNGGAAAKAPLKDAIAAFEKALEPLREGKGAGAPNLGAIGELLASLATDVEGSDRVPPAAQEQVLADSRERLARATATWKAVQENELVAFDQALSRAALPPIHVPTVEEIRIGEPSEGKDLP